VTDVHLMKLVRYRFHENPYSESRISHNGVNRSLIYFLHFSILCLTTDPIHQGHEERKKSVTSARSPRNTSAQLRDRE